VRRILARSERARNRKSIDWEAEATRIHARYGHLSHDYSLLNDIIRCTHVTSVLEIGCGSGRLFPAYLKNNLNPIWAQDVSSTALAIAGRRFINHPQIHYLHMSLVDVPRHVRPDLVVSTRVLQHVTDDKALVMTLRCLTTLSPLFFVNETTDAEPTISHNPFLKGRDYVPLFQELGFGVAAEGILEAEGGTRQYWKLFQSFASSRLTLASTTEQPNRLCITGPPRHV
jgi:SAM-dependent methyltransferase